jgi:hypothetical protein
MFNPYVTESAARQAMQFAGIGAGDRVAISIARQDYIAHVSQTFAYEKQWWIDAKSAAARGPVGFYET